MKRHRPIRRLPRPIGRLLRELKAQVLDERGVAMLEFVLVAPIMCYLIASILFFQTHIDYAQDQIMKTRQKTWEKALPNAALSVSGDNSDDSKFFLLPLRETLMVAALADISFNTGALLAKARYLGGTGFGTPYDTIELKRDNYFIDYITPDAVPETGWAKMMGGFGQWFGTKIGTGDATTPEGLKTSKWKDRYPFTVNPWMRQYSDKLDPSAYSIPFLSFLNMGLVWAVMDTIPNGDRCHLNRFDDRDDIDIGENHFTHGFLIDNFNESGTCDQLKLEEIGSGVESIVE